MAGLLNFNNQPQQGGLLAGLQNAVGNPMTLAGLGLLSGEGFGGAMRGAQLGMSFQDQQRQEAERRRKQQGFESLLGQINAPPDVLALARFQGPEAATETIGQWVGPAQEARRLEMELKRAQIAKARREAADAGARFGKTGSIVQGSDGKFYSVQWGNDGSRVILPMELPGAAPTGAPGPAAAPEAPAEGAGRFGSPALSNSIPPVALTPARGVDVVGDQMFDKATGDPVRNVGGQIQAGAFAKGVGEQDADFVGKFPKVHLSYKSFVNKTDNVLGIIDRAINSVGPNTTGWMGIRRVLPADAARELENDLKTIYANVAFAELNDMRANSPTGGALGNVTERELDLLASTQGSLDQMQSGKRVKENLEIIRRNLSEIKRLRSEAFAMDYARYRKLMGAEGGAGQQPAQGADGWRNVGGVRIREKR
jgi:hypothetical protein